MKNQHLIKYKNPVLIKDEEGKVRQTTYDLPPQSHTYGKKVVDDPQPTKYVVNSWQVAQGSDQKAPKQKNFQELNKRSTLNGLHTAKDQTGFRKMNDVMVKVKEGKKVIPILLPEEQFTYGQPNRPSTPVKLVVGNCYAIDQQNKNATMYQHETEKHYKNKTVAKKTKSQLLRENKVGKEKQYRAKPVVEEQFKIGKFTKTGAPRINSNLSAFQHAAKSALQGETQGQ